MGHPNPGVPPENGLQAPLGRDPGSGPIIEQKLLGGNSDDFRESWGMLRPRGHQRARIGAPLKAGGPASAGSCRAM